MHCALAALGFNQAYTLFSSAFTTGMTATTALQALKFVGVKYLGYIALAVAVYEFIECVNSDEGIPRQLVAKQLDSYLLPLPLNPVQLYCTSPEAVLDTVNNLWLNTTIFQNSANNKYTQIVVIPHLCQMVIILFVIILLVLLFIELLMG
ncbi:hypothetical protein [uncultured Pedobacter sp.]|uniref:hypothetical protein n=1 Tax=uncultured Pedobacter sp. TaxID=246139 RepID=UPI0025CC9302|nr:hypothetical protein [uncultured Pedobacter sp.]